MPILIFCVNHKYLSCKYYCIDETMMIVTKKVNKHIMSGLFFASLAAYPMSPSAEWGARMTEGN